VKRALVPFVVSISLGTAGAQPGAQEPPPPAPPAAPPAVAIDVFLEQRVAEELAIDGIILSRFGVALDVELVGTVLIVSLVDPATRRAIVSTKVDDLPADREAAVASVTQVAENLTIQLRSLPPPDPRAELEAALARERAARDSRTWAEHLYRQEYLALGPKWTVYRGEYQKRLRGTAIYQALGRPDLAKRYSRSRSFKILSAVGVGVFGTLAIGYLSMADQVEEEQKDNYEMTGTILLVGALACGGVMIAHWNPHPISEAAITELIRGHNYEVRHRLGLAGLRTPERPRLYDLQVVPAVTTGGGGLVLSGRF
jgi:hypothetical protein